MLAIQDPEDQAVTAGLELRALERMAAVLCECLEELTREYRESFGGSREASLQLAVCAERREAALKALATESSEPAETRIARLEKLVEALHCSRAFFGAHATG